MVTAAILTGCAHRADLVVQGASIAPAANCAPHQAVLNAQVTVKNVGDAPSQGRTDVGIVGVVESTPSATAGGYWGNGAGLPAVPPGGTAAADVPIYYLIADPQHMIGPHSFNVDLNAGNWIDESNDSNNRFGPIAVTVPPPECGGNRYLIEGADMGVRAQNIKVQLAGNDVATAAVSVNNTPLTFQAGKYRGNLPSFVPVGGPLTLAVTVPEGTIQSHDTIPEAPVVTAPAPKQQVAVAQPLHVDWTSQTNPDRFSVSLNWSCGNGCNTGVSFDVPGSSRAFDVAAGTLPANQTVNLNVFAYNDGTETFGGPYDAGSRMSIRNATEPNGRPLATVK